MPSKLPPSERMAVLMPITSPRLLKSGPPELPGLIAASVWITSAMLYTPPLEARRFSTVRPRALTTPVVKVVCKLNGLPIAIARCPTSTCFESPNGNGRTPSGSCSTLITAISESGSAPTTLASTVKPLVNETSISLAFSTTWLLVAICPWSSNTKPEPAASKLNSG